MMATDVDVLSATSDTTFTRHTRRQIGLRLLPFLFVLYIVNYIDRTNLSFAVLGMSRDLGFNERVFGLGVGLFFVGYVAMQIPGALLVERWSARKMIAICMVTWGLLTVATALVRTPMQLYAARFVIGAAEAAFFPGVLLYLSHWFVREDRAKSASNFMAAIPLSSVLGAPFAGWILGHQWMNLQGWRWLFVVEGLPSIVLGVAALFYLTDRPNGARWLTAEQRQWVSAKLAHEKKNAVKALSLFETIRSRTVVMLVLACFFSYFSYYAFIFYYPTMLKAQSGLSDARIGLLGMLPFAVTFVAMQVNAWHSDRRGERLWHATVPELIGAAGLLLLAASPSSTAVTVGLFALVASATAFLPVFWAIPGERLSGSAAATATGLINGFGSIAGIAGPYVFGYLKSTTGSYTAGLLTLTISTLMAALLIATNRKPQSHADKVLVAAAEIT
jgi:ACS family tartrate transporter-like MFS transporter